MNTKRLLLQPGWHGHGVDHASASRRGLARHLRGRADQLDAQIKVITTPHHTVEVEGNPPTMGEAIAVDRAGRARRLSETSAA
jgi:hypothetical protein